MNETADQETHHVESSSEEEKEAENEQNPQLAKMKELEARLNVITNRSEL